MSTYKIVTLGLLIPLALAAPLAAQSRGGPDGASLSFSQLDTDGNGALTLDELQARGQARFAESDTDGDGVLSRDEMLRAASSAVADRVDRRIERADANGDGALSLAELEEARDGRRGPNLERLFGRMDADDDGTISEAEFDTAMERMRERRENGRDRDRG